MTGDGVCRSLTKPTKSWTLYLQHYNMRSLVVFGFWAIACGGGDGKSVVESGSGGATNEAGSVSTGGATSEGSTLSSGGTNSSGGRLATGGSAGIGCTGNLELIHDKTGLCVAKMATIAGPASDAGSKDYSIDVTEVTRGQYDAWLASNPALPPSDDADCGWKTSYAEQGTGFAGDNAEHHPVSYVDWCDAHAYCAGVGKRMCGAIGGGSVDFAGFADANASQWYRACSSGGAHTYPYGNTFKFSSCNGIDNTAGDTVAVGSMQNCVASESGYSGVYDLNGNVWEWEDSCLPSGRWAYCHLRGASFASDEYFMPCDFGGYNQRFYAYDYVGFRCCSDSASTGGGTSVGSGGSTSIGSGGNTSAGGGGTTSIDGGANTGGDTSMAGDAGGAGGLGDATGGAASAGSTSTTASGGAATCGAPGPSCDGGLDCNGDSCCKSLPLPSGTYNRYANTAPLPTTLDNFCLDKYEITVGRFRKFANAYDAWRAAGHPMAGEGAHGIIPNSGWDTAWSTNLPATAAQMTDTSHVNCVGTGQALGSPTWRDSAGTATNENYPINCLNWYQSEAFCIWDGGYLPTEAEWEYAAAGGSEQRKYAWGDDSTEPFPANYCSFQNLEDCTPYMAVGSYPGGNARWGHADLGGSVWEWVLDWYAKIPDACNNCANLTPASNRSLRGGGWVDDPWDLASNYRAFWSLTYPQDRIGARCARAAR